MSKLNNKGWSKADAKKALHPYEQKHPYAFLEQDLKHHDENPNKGSHADCSTCQDAINERLAMRVISKDGVNKTIAKYKEAK